MKTEMDDIDKIIKEALSEDEAKFYDDLNEPPVLKKLGDVYKGQLGWLARMMNIVMILLFILVLYALINFWKAAESLEMIRWAVVGIISLMAIGFLKLYFWMQMDKNDLKRELKRIELQLAVILSKLDH